MAKQRNYSTEFKRQVVLEYQAVLPGCDRPVTIEEVYDWQPVVDLWERP